MAGGTGTAGTTMAIPPFSSTQDKNLPQNHNDSNEIKQFNGIAHSLT